MVIAATANIRETLPHKVAELALDKVLTAAATADGLSR